MEGPVWPLLQVYDEMVFEADAGRADELKAELVRVMSTSFEGVEIPASGSVAESWGALK